MPQDTCPKLHAMSQTEARASKQRSRTPDHAAARRDENQYTRRSRERIRWSVATRLIGIVSLLSVPVVAHSIVLDLDTSDIESGEAIDASAMVQRFDDITAAFSQVDPPGTIEPWLFDPVKTGWIALDGQTIGTEGSGADHAGAEPEALFVLFWENFDNAALPIQDSTGAPTSRGGNALADFDDGKRLPVFDARALVPRGVGTQAINGRDKTGPDLGAKQEDQIQGHWHAGVETTAGVDYSGFNNGRASGSLTSVSASSPAASNLRVQDPVTDGSNDVPRVGTETRIAGFGVRWIVKL